MLDGDLATDGHDLWFCWRLNRGDVWVMDVEEEG
jgi:hypothetical protein